MAQAIGFIGLGNMGKPMAVNLAKAGFDLTVCDLRPEPLVELRALGAQAGSAAEIAERCDVVEIVVVSDSQVRELCLGGDGLVDRAKPGATILIHSTVHPRTCREVADAAREREVGVLDAPVSGAEEAARAAALTFMVGGDIRMLEEVRPVLEAMGKNIFHLGDVGMGQVGKLTNNFIALINLMGAYEGVRLGTAAGIDQATLLQMVRASSGNSWIVERWDVWWEGFRQAYTTGAQGLAELMLKDISLALSVGNDAGVSLPVGALASQMARKVLGLEA